MFKIKIIKYLIFNGFKKKGKNNGILNVWINGEKMTSYNKMNLLIFQFPIKIIRFRMLI